MGAEYNGQMLALPVQAGSEAVKEEFVEMVKEAAWNYGHAGYSGSWAEKEAVEVLDMVFVSEHDAKEYIIEHNCKWGPATAAKVADVGWYVGGWCSS